VRLALNTPTTEEKPVNTESRSEPVLSSPVRRAWWDTTAIVWVFAIGLGVAAVAEPARAQSAGARVSAPVIYPAKGQSAQQQDKDRYECHDWARGQSGYDPTQASLPAAAPTNPTTVPATSTSATAQTMVAGAAGGAAVAELTHHDAGRAAAVGVLGGAMLDRSRQRQAAQAQQQQQQQAQQQGAQQRAAIEQQLATYGRAQAACMEARGYVLK
jgi:hypothetical protein